MTLASPRCYACAPRHARPTPSNPAAKCSMTKTRPASRNEPRPATQTAWACGRAGERRKGPDAFAHPPIRFRACHGQWQRSRQQPPKLSLAAPAMRERAHASVRQREGANPRTTQRAQHSQPLHKPRELRVSPTHNDIGGQPGPQAPVARQQCLRCHLGNACLPQSWPGLRRQHQRCERARNKATGGGGRARTDNVGSEQHFGYRHSLRIQLHRLPRGVRPALSCHTKSARACDSDAAAPAEAPSPAATAAANDRKPSSAVGVGAGASRG